MCIAPTTPLWDCRATAVFRHLAGLVPREENWTFATIYTVGKARAWGDGIQPGERELWKVQPGKRLRPKVKYGVLVW